ncbi:MAG: Ig-like domain-containing protein [Caldilineaceae bacterium]
MANDVDPDGDALTALVVSDVISGVLTLAVDGTFTYTPTAGFAGRDQFLYVAADGLAQSSPVMVTIDVRAHNSRAATCIRHDGIRETDPR